MALVVASRGLILLSLALCVLGSQNLRTYTSTSNSLLEPEVIQVPANYKVKVFLSARGDQHYRYNGTSWVIHKAKAKLYDHEEKQIGRHFYLKHPDSEGGQPSWETLPSHGAPESLVTGVAVAHVTVDTDSIPWVQLKATNNKGSKKYFGDVEYILRINTVKGLPPSSTSGAKKGDACVSRYTSDYVFYVKE